MKLLGADGIRGHRSATIQMLVAGMKTKEHMLKRLKYY